MASLDDLDNYNVDDFDADDPFRSPSPQPVTQPGKSTQEAQSKKRKGDGLGIDEEVDVAKRARVPRVKLDETKLLSDDGIPKLRKRARDLKFKGKGHEFSDAARLLSFYQFWLDDLFPKAKFLDALAMVEKTGHKRILATKRLEWINEGKPNSSTSVLAGGDDEMPPSEEQTTSNQNGAPSRATPQPTNTRTDGGGGDDDNGVPPDDEDLWGATPLRPKPKPPAGPSVGPNANSDMPDDEEDLDALMAEAEADTLRQTQGGNAGGQSIFGDGGPDHSGRGSAATRPKSGEGNKAQEALEEDDMDDLDALMAEAEADTSRRQTSAKDANAGNKNAAAGNGDKDEEDARFADDEAAMAEMDGMW